MAKQRFFDFDQTFLDNLAKEKKSLVSLHCSNYHLTLLPWQFENLRKSLRDLLNEDVSYYNRKLGGIVLGHKNLKLLSEIGFVHKERSFVHINIMADFFIFKPEIGKTVSGTVIQKSEDIICQVYNCFTISLPKPRLVREEEDSEQRQIWSQAEIGDILEIHITFFSVAERLATIKGHILSRKSTNSPKTNTELNTEENTDKRKKKRKRTSSISKQLVEDTNNLDIPQDQIEESTETVEKSSKKKRKRTSSNHDNSYELDLSQERSLSKKSKHSVTQPTQMTKDEESSKTSKKKDSLTEINEPLEDPLFVKLPKKKKQSKAKESFKELSDLNTPKKYESNKTIKSSFSELENDSSDIDAPNTSLEDKHFENESQSYQESQTGNKKSNRKRRKAEESFEKLPDLKTPNKHERVRKIKRSLSEVEIDSSDFDAPSTSLENKHFENESQSYQGSQTENKKSNRKRGKVKESFEKLPDLKTPNKPERVKKIKRSLSEFENDSNDVDAPSTSLENKHFENEPQDSQERQSKKKLKTRKRSKSISLNETESKFRVKQETVNKEEEIDYSDYVIKPDEIILPDLDYKSILESTESSIILPQFDFGHSSRLFDAESMQRESPTQIIPAKKYKKSRSVKEESDDETVIVKKIKKEK